MCDDDNITLASSVIDTLFLFPHPAHDIMTVLFLDLHVWVWNLTVLVHKPYGVVHCCMVWHKPYGF